MVMNSSAHAYTQAQSYELRKMQVLDGKQAKAREDAKRGDVVKITLVVSAVFLYLFGMTFLSANICSMGVEMNSLKTQIADTQNMTARAELELGEMAALERVEAYATNDLNMVYPQADDIYILNEESSMEIAQGKQELTIAEAEITVVAEENPMWRSIVDGFSNFFMGTASASEK